MVRLYASFAPFCDYERLHRAAYDLLYFVLARDFHLKKEDLVLLKTAEGKPYFRDVPIHFSVSHTEGLVVVAIGKNEVGVDAEKSTRILKSSVAARFLHKESAAIGDWVSYESIGKLFGCGIPYTSNEIVENYYTKMYSDVSGYVICCATEEDAFLDSIEIV